MEEYYRHELMKTLPIIDTLREYLNCSSTDGTLKKNELHKTLKVLLEKLDKNG